MTGRFSRLTRAAAVWATALLIGAALPSGASAAQAERLLPDLPAQAAVAAAAPLGAGVLPWGGAAPIADARLAGAAALAYGFAPGWRPVAEQAAARGVSIEWGELAPELLAAYFRREDRIVINAAFRGDSLASIAALLAHEAYHAAAQGCWPPLTPGACLAEETAAASWAASVYTSIPAGFRSDADLDQVLAGLARRWQAGALQQWVAADPYYRRAYFPLAAACSIVTGLWQSAP